MVALVLAAAIGVYTAIVRPRMLAWGATAAEGTLRFRATVSCPVGDLMRTSHDIGGTPLARSG